MKKVLIGILIGLIVGVGCLFVYNEFFVKKDNATKTDKKETTEKEETKTEEELNINSQLVQNLYNYVKMEKSYLAGVSYIGIFEDKNKVLASELSQDLKNYLGYRQLSSDLQDSECPSSLLQQNKCSNYDKDFPNAEGTDTWTQSFSEEKLKEKVELIFGKDSYNSGDFLGCQKYGLCVYDSVTKKYYDTDCRCGGTGWMPTIELKSAKKVDNKIEINEYVRNDFDNKHDEWNLKYTFTLSEDGNYYFESVEKIN